jgi:peptidoglycan/LPS O-acetylase OafA/YrhL
LILPAYGFYSWLNQSLVCQIGVLSYSIYIWQQLFASPAEFMLRPVWWLSFPGWLVPALVVALVSYYGLERPWFRLRARFRDS